MNRIIVPPQPCSEPWRTMKKPENILDFRENVDGWERTWQEFVSSGYDGSTPVPLVLDVHGGSTHTADVKTAWTLVAEREGFIVLFPHSIRDGRTWNVWNEYTREEGMPDDVKYFTYLIDLMQKKYNIDPTRIYIQGQSMGDMMTTTYIFGNSDVFAAAAPLSGPRGSSRFINENGDIVYGPQRALPVIRTHGTEDLGLSFGKRALRDDSKPITMAERLEAPRHKIAPEDVPEQTRRDKWLLHQLMNLRVWLDRNGCEQYPELTLCGRYNSVLYRGDPCDTEYYIVARGEHGPYLDMADNLWTYFFTRYRRIDGKIVRTEPNKRRPVDKDAVAVSDGAAMAYVANRLVPIDSARPELTAKVVEGIYYVPAGFMPTAFPGMTAEFGDGGESVTLSCGDKTLSLSMGNRVTVYNGYLRDLERTLWLDGALYVPIGDIAKLLFGKCLTQRYGAAYINDAGGEMTYDFAYIINELLGSEKHLTNADLYRMEKELELARASKAKK